MEILYMYILNSMHSKTKTQHLLWVDMVFVSSLHFYPRQQWSSVRHLFIFPLLIPPPPPPPRTADQRGAAADNQWQIHGTAAALATITVKWSSWRHRRYSAHRPLILLSRYIPVLFPCKLTTSRNSELATFSRPRNLLNVLSLSPHL